MTSTEKKWKYENDEEEKLAKYLISLEEEALKKIFQRRYVRLQRALV